VQARRGRFFQTGKNSLSLKQLASLEKTPSPGRNDFQAKKLLRSCD
jgi:hypothetical protein